MICIISLVSELFPVEVNEAVSDCEDAVDVSCEDPEALVDSWWAMASRKLTLPSLFVSAASKFWRMLEIRLERLLSLPPISSSWLDNSSFVKPSSFPSWGGGGGIRGCLAVFSDYR